MEHPTCPEHPGSRVCRDGYYGSQRQYQRWRCFPGEGREGSHLIRPVLPHGTAGRREAGAASRFDRLAIHAISAGRRARYSFRAKAAALAHLARGHTYRAAAIRARDPAGSAGHGAEPQDVSTDGRLAADWVSQYAPLLAREYLPTRWPEALVIQHLSLDPHSETTGRSRKKLYVFGALSYGPGRAADARQPDRLPLLWRLGAYRSPGERAWRDFLRQLPGTPAYIVCGRGEGLRRALARHWPGVPVFSCAAALSDEAREHLRAAELEGSALGAPLEWRTFTSRERYHAFRAAAERLQSGSGAVPGSGAQPALDRLRAWLDEVDAEVELLVSHSHQPLTTGEVEQPLRWIRNALYDRRVVLRNLPRLNHLLVLMQLHQMGRVSVNEWARRLKRAYLESDGVPPPRRRLDDPLLRPGR